MEKDIAEKQDELEAVQKERAGQESAIDAIAKDIADTERRLQVTSMFLTEPSFIQMNFLLTAVMLHKLSLQRD